MNTNWLLGSRGRSMSQLVDKACQRWEMQRRAPAQRKELSAETSRPFSIALSREAGTQGTTVAQEVGRLLNWDVYDQELLEHVAQDMGVQAKLLKSVDERHQSWLVESIEAFLSAPREGDWGHLVTESGFVHQLVKTVLALGTHGECVIVGRGAAFILPPETTLRARLVGPEQERIAVLSNRLAISETEAARQLGVIDGERTEFVQSHFFKDPADPQNYDLVLDTAGLSVTKIAEQIAKKLRTKQTS